MNNTNTLPLLSLSVIKRDAATEPYDIIKIERALSHAFKHLHCVIEVSEMARILKHIDTIVRDCAGNSLCVNIESVQDAVETALMTAQFFDVAKHYIQYRTARAEKRKTETYVSKIPDDVDTPWGMLGYITYKRTYARALPTGATEEFRDTVLRVLDACQKQLNVGFSNDEIKRAYSHMMSLRCSVAGRFLWQLLSPTVSKLGLMSLQNCAFVKIDAPVKPFTWIFDVLMLGTGVGFNIQKCNIEKIPPVCNTDILITRKNTKDADFIVPDSREGWVSLLEKTLEAFFIKGKGFTYSTILVRSAGSKISGFGGTASGPEDLVKGIDNLSKILTLRKGSHVSSVDCLDIVNIIASIVVAGNVRRSALIAIGDANDIPYLNAKRWDFGNIPNWRCMSNNSVVCENTAELPPEFWGGYRGGGECYGLVNLALSRKVGRLADGELYPDPSIEGYNPCCEQGLANHETCCLGEIFLPNIKSFDQLCDSATLLYRICKHSLLLPCHHPETNDVVHANMRMGLGITGYMQCTDEQKGWLAPLYEHLRAFDTTYSAKLGCPVSVKLTTVKPSGTLSLLAGVTPGCHPGIFQHFIRRIRIASNSALISVCRDHGYFIEYQRNFDGTDDKNTMVVEFPCKYPEGTVLAEHMNAIQQLETIKKLQTEWSDNAVSVTVYYRLEELPDIQSWLLENFTNSVKSVSFMLHTGHNFAQAPFEEITEAEYTTRLAAVRPIVSGNIECEDQADLSNETCKGGVCPVR